MNDSLSGGRVGYPLPGGWCGGGGTRGCCVPDATPAPTNKAPTDEDDALPEDGATPDDGAPPPGDVIDNWSDVDDPTAVPMSAGDDALRRQAWTAQRQRAVRRPGPRRAGETAAPTVAQTAEPTVENQWWLMPAAATR